MTFLEASPNRIMGSIVYRTREALNGDAEFLGFVREYAYSPNLFAGDRFNLWHYPGTRNEICNALKEVNDPRFKFPAVLNFQNIQQRVEADYSTIYYNVAIIAPVLSTWLTQEREAEVFDHVLRPVYREFMRQVAGSGYFLLPDGEIPRTVYEVFGTGDTRSGYFLLPAGEVPRTMYEVFTTGGGKASLVESYGDYVDALEVHGLALRPRPCYREGVVERMVEENGLVLT
jgi:hypothetical protein